MGKAGIISLVIAIGLTSIVGGCTKSFLGTFPTGPYVNHVETDTRHTWQCVTDTSGKHLRNKPFMFKGTSYVAEEYDRNYDGHTDMVLFYGYVGNGRELFPFPDRYLLIEPEGRYEYVDINNDGRCTSIRNVAGNPDKSEPGSLALPKSHKKEYPKEEIMPGQDGEDPSCSEHENPGEET